MKSIQRIPPLVSSITVSRTVHLLLAMVSLWFETPVSRTVLIVQFASVVSARAVDIVAAAARRAALLGVHVMVVEHVGVHVETLALRALCGVEAPLGTVHLVDLFAATVL